MKNLVIAILLLLPSLARATPIECTFKSRPDDYFFRELPKEVIGMISCGGSENINTILVVHLPENEVFLKWFKGYEKAVTVVPVSTAILASSASGTKTELEIETHRELDSLDHFVFSAAASDGSRFFFLYTDTPERSRELRGNVKAIGRELTMPEYVTQIDRAI